MRRLATALAVVLVPAMVVGCSSSGGGKSGGASGTPTSTSTRAATAAASPAAAALAAKIRTGLAGLTSAHLVVDAGALGGTSAGDVSFRDGTATGSDVVSGSGGDRTEIITVGGTSYAKLPSGRNTSGKPWVLVSADSKNEFVRALSDTVSLTQATASLPLVADIVATATSVTDRGAAATGHRYDIVIAPAAAGTSPLASLLKQLGQQAVPVTLYLDSANRPTDVRITVALGAQRFPFTVAVSRFNAPVTITAPPKDQVSTG